MGARTRMQPLMTCFLEKWKPESKRQLHKSGSWGRLAHLQPAGPDLRGRSSSSRLAVRSTRRQSDPKQTLDAHGMEEAPGLKSYEA